MKYLAKSIILLFVSFLAHGKAEYKLIDNAKKEFYQKVFFSAHFKEEIAIKDNISKNPINNKILKIYDKNKNLIGYLRNIETTTGCDGACLPVIFTLFYNSSFCQLIMSTKEDCQPKKIQIHYNLPYVIQDGTVADTGRARIQFYDKLIHGVSFYTFL